MEGNNLIFKKANIKIFIICIGIIIAMILPIKNVQANTTFGEFYELDGNSITRILPETTVSDFKNNLENTNIIVKDEKGNVVADDEYVGSGMTATIDNKSYNLSVIGDVNGDGKVTVTDLIKLQLSSLGMTELDNKYKNSADINDNKEFTITDLAQAKLAIVEIKDIVAPESFIPIVTSSSNSVTVIGDTADRNSGVAEYYFKIDNGNWIQASDKKSSIYTFSNISDNETHTVRMKVVDNAGNKKKTQAVNTSLATGNIKIIPSNTEWTNENITVAVEYSINRVDIDKLISIDGGNTFEKYTEPVTITKNTKVVAKLESNLYGLIEEKSLDITNIDKILPNEFEIKTEANVNTVKVSAIAEDGEKTLEFGKSEIKEYTYNISNGVWFQEITTSDTEFTFEELNDDETYKVKVIARDNAGNERVSETEVKTDVEYSTAVFVKLYTDGTLGFSSKDSVMPGKEVLKSYGDIQNVRYSMHCAPWVNENVTTVDFERVIHPKYTDNWFALCAKLTTVKNIQNLDTSNVVSMAHMFCRCTSLVNIDLSSFDTRKVTDMQFMFNSCTSLQNVNLKGFNTYNVKTMDYMFNSCKNLRKILVGSGWKLAKSTAGMLSGCYVKPTMY